MKPDLSEFVGLSKPRHRLCPIEAAIADLSEGKDLEAALATDKRFITANAISQWLKRRDIAASPALVGAHRRGQCSCFRNV